MADDDRRAAAEARRLKILARGKDRLTQITTGVAAVVSKDAAQPTEPASTPPLDRQPGSLSSAPCQATQELLQQQPQQEEQAAGRSEPEVSSSEQPPVQLTQPTAVQPTAGATVQGIHAATAYPSDQAVHLTSARRRKPTSLDEEDETLDSTAPMVAAGSKVGLAANPQQADLLQHAVNATALPRCLAAMGLAYALLNGHLNVQQLRMRPAAMLAIVQLALIGGFFMLLTSPAMRAHVRVRATEEARLAKFQAFSMVRMASGLVPGLSNTMALFQALVSTLSSMKDVTAVYIVTLVMIQALTAV